MGDAYKRRATDATKDADWLRSMWDWAAEMERDYEGVAIQLSLYPTGRKGVWRTQLRALEMVDGRPMGIRVQIGGEYPNAQNASLGAWLFNQTVQLEDALAQHKENPLRVRVKD